MHYFIHKIQGCSLDLYDVVKQVEAAKLHLKCEMIQTMQCIIDALNMRRI